MGKPAIKGVQVAMGTRPLVAFGANISGPIAISDELGVRGLVDPGNLHVFCWSLKAGTRFSSLFV